MGDYHRWAQFATAAPQVTTGLQDDYQKLEQDGEIHDNADEDV